MRLGYGMVARGGLHSEVFLHLGFLYADHHLLGGEDCMKDGT